MTLLLPNQEQQSLGYMAHEQHSQW